LTPHSQLAIFVKDMVSPNNTRLKMTISRIMPGNSFR
jgi:hypothetical protein